MSEDRSGFWRDPNRSVLGMFYMGGSVVAFAAGLLDGTAELVAVVGWVLITVGFYWVVHAILTGGLLASRAESTT